MSNQFTRRQMLAGMAATGSHGFVLASGSLDRHAIVKRHNPVLKTADIDSVLQVGNGEFAFSADITGLQTLADAYDKGMPLGTMAQWAWHSFPNPENFQLAEALRPYDAHGRSVLYVDGINETGPSNAPQRAQAAATWLRENPHRIHLARIGLVLAEGKAISPDEITESRQELDLWTGTITSEFTVRGARVRVETVCHPERDLLAFRITSPGLKQKGLGICIAFPYASRAWAKGYDWTSPARYQTKMTSGEGGATFTCILDDTRYTAAASWPGGAHIKEGKPHEFVLSTEALEEIELSIEFSPKEVAARPPSFAAIHAAAANYWPAFWKRGGAIDFSACTDPRAFELERRVVLSQYLMAVNCAGSMPPQETGLVTNSWCGKSHLEMHWWHAAHFVLWGRPELLERSLAWYRTILPRAKATATLQGYRGARWSKQIGPEGRETPSDISPFLVWQQPHFIYYAELLYRLAPNRKTLEAYGDLVFETAEFMASYAAYDASTQRYVLGPPLVPAQESYYKARARLTNPTYELAYWHWGLATAQLWRERLKMSRQPAWDKVIGGLARPTVRNGVYTAMEQEPFTVYNDHPSMLCALGVLPGTPLIEFETMRATLDDVLARWNWKTTWGWDYPLMAMTAARLGEPRKAIDTLLMDAPKNNYLAGGQNFGAKGVLPLYLPGNGGLLYAVAMMAGGWDGAKGDAPGFPASRGWKIRWEGLRMAL